MFKYILQDRESKKYYRYSYVTMDGPIAHEVIGVDLAKRFDTEEEAKQINRDEYKNRYEVRKVLK